MNARHPLLASICFMTAAALAWATGPDDPNEAPMKVHVCVPVERQIAPYEAFTGRLDAGASVELKPRVSGYLERVLFKDGAEVKKGDVLFEIDPRPYQAQLAKAEADLSVSEARLRSTTNVLERVAEGAKTGAIGREVLDKAAGEREVAQANIQIARAALDAARITLGYAKVVSPIDGRIGRRLLDAGNLVKADETILANIVNSDSMCVLFDIDERTLLLLNQATKEGKRKEFAATIGLAGETGFPRQAKVDFVDNHVDAAKGTIRVRAVLLDSDKQLRPGMFCSIRLTTGEPQQSLLVPDRAIVTLSGARALYIVNDKNIVELRPVEVGRLQSGEMRIVTKGLKADERVVLDAFRRLIANAPVGAVELVDSAWRPMAVRPTPAATNKKP